MLWNMAYAEYRYMPLNFPIVCFGGSAVDLDEYTQLLSALPVDLDVAFVIIDNLKQVARVLHDSLSKCTKMPVDFITEGLPVQRNHVFVLQEGRDLHMVDGAFHLAPKSKPTGWPDTITVFLRSLTSQWHGQLIAVILAGYDGDGAAALCGVKEVGGITIAQKVDTITHQDMPLSAIASGCVDFILSIDDIAKEIVRIAHASRIEV